MALSIADRPWRKWALRAIAGFLLVYMLEPLGIPTLVPYMAVLLAVLMDAARLATRNRRTDDSPQPIRNEAECRRETIH